MPLTREFRETVRARAQADARYRAAMFTEAVNELLAGDLATGKALLRDYVNATLTFDRLAEATGFRSKACNACSAPGAIPRLRISLPSSRPCRMPSTSSWR